MKHTYTEEEKEKIAQDDESQIVLEVNILRNRGIDSINFMCVLDDIKDVTER